MFWFSLVVFVVLLLVGFLLCLRDIDKRTSLTLWQAYRWFLPAIATITVSYFLV